MLFSIPPITESKVIGCLKSINLHKACGIDKFSPRMLKLAAPIIAPSIAKLINHFFNTASFPQRWKTAKVSPLFKGGDSEDLIIIDQFLFCLCSQKPGGGGTPMRNRRGCSSEILNLTPKGDQSGRGLSKF